MAGLKVEFKNEARKEQKKEGRTHMFFSMKVTEEERKFSVGNTKKRIRKGKKCKDIAGVRNETSKKK